MAATYVGDFQLKGADLRKRGLNRIGNMLVPNRWGPESLQGWGGGRACETRTTDTWAWAAPVACTCAVVHTAWPVRPAATTPCPVHPSAATTASLRTG